MLAAALIEGYERYGLRERALIVFTLRALAAFRDNDSQLPLGL